MPGAAGGPGSAPCGVKTDATVAYWGYNREGQATVPAGTFLSADLGVRVAAPPSAKSRSQMSYAAVVAG
jgi:hypothetical protein